MSARIAPASGRPGDELYDRWDALNKRAQKDYREWTSYATLAWTALATAYEPLGVRGDAGTDVDELLASLGDWLLWPDVEEHLLALGRRYRIGVLSNVDDDLFGRTRAARWWTRSS